MADDAAPVSDNSAIPDPTVVAQQPSTVILQNRHGNLETVDSSEAQQAIQQGGYSVPDPSRIAQAQEHAKYSSLPQQAATALEGAGVASSFGLSTGLEKILGVNPEDIRKRQETNPGSHMIGEIGGLTLGAATGSGEAKALELAGEGVAKAFIPEAAEGAGFLARGATKIGTAAVKGAIETAMVQGGDEVSKMLAEDPNQTAQTALTNIGLAGLFGAGIGGGVGAVSPLWEATVGTKVGTVLRSLSEKAGGGASTVSDELSSALEKSGLDLPPEVRAGLSEDPHIRQMFKTLEQSDTTGSGLKFQETLKNFREQTGNSLAESLGVKPEEVSGLGDLSEYEGGKKIGHTLADEFEAQVKPLSDTFEEIKKKYADVDLPQDVRASSKNYNPYEPGGGTATPGTTSEISDKIAQLIQREGWYTSPSSDIMREVNRVQRELPNLKTLKDLSNYMTQIGANTADYTNPPLMRAGQMMKSILRDAEADVVTQKLGEEAPQLVGEHQMAREAWKHVAQIKDELDARLHVGGGNSPTSFIKNLREMADSDGEKVLRRLSGKNDADLLRLLTENQVTGFPKTAEAIRDFHVKNLLKNASAKASGDQLLSSRVLLSSVNKMSPELRSFVLPAGAAEKIQGIQAILDHFDSMPHNFSNSGRVVDKLWSYLPGSAIGMASMLMNHNPAMAFLLGSLTKWIGRDAPDAIRLGMLKFLGSEKPIDPGAFKSMIDFVHHTTKGESLVNRATKGLFKSTTEVLPQALVPSEKDRQKLDTQLKKLQTDPTPLFQLGGKTAHYLPDHGTALAETGANAANYLNSLRPSTDKQSPLDTERKPSAPEQAAYNRALNIAEQPLLVMKNIEKGTLTPQDVSHLQNLYPALYQRLTQKVTSEMMEAVNRGDTIDYKKRLSLSLFLGQPLDSTMTSSNIQTSQAVFQMNSSPPSQAPQMRPKHSMAALGKMGRQDATAAQSREASRLTR